MSTDPIGAVVEAHEAVLEAQARMQDLAAERDVLVRDALASGVSAVELAAALGLNRARVYAMASRP